VKSQRKAPTPEQEVRKCDGKRSEEMRMDIIGSIRKPIRSAGDEPYETRKPRRYGSVVEDIVERGRSAMAAFPNHRFRVA